MDAAMSGAGDGAETESQGADETTQQDTGRESGRKRLGGPEAKPNLATARRGLQCVAADEGAGSVRG